ELEHQSAQIALGEAPVKGLGHLLVMALEAQQALLEFAEGTKIIRSEGLAMGARCGIVPPSRSCGSRKKRLRHLLTIRRGVFKRAARSSLSSPAAAYSTILARMTSRYGDVYLRAVASRRARSPEDSSMRYGHVLGMNLLLGGKGATGGDTCQNVPIS